MLKSLFGIGDRRRHERISCRYETSISFRSVHSGRDSVKGEVKNISKTGFLFEPATPQGPDADYAHAEINIMNFPYRFRVVRVTYLGLHSEFELPLTEQKWLEFKDKYGRKNS